MYLNFDTTNIDIPQLRKVVEWAEVEAAKPRELSRWEQDWWVSDDGEWGEYDAHGDYHVMQKDPECGTCFCIAGQLVYCNLNAGEYLDSDTVRNRRGNVVTTVAARALDLLNVTYEGMPSRFPLFSAENSIEDIREIAEELAGERL
jgi:hypothetical protein